jgi:hypothetical protein
MGSLQPSVPTLESLLSALDIDGPIEPFLALARWLEGRGEPWGELIAAQCAAEGKPAGSAESQHASKLLRAHGRDLCFLHGVFGSSVFWRRGFVCFARLDNCSIVESFASELSKLFALPAFTLCRELSLRGAYMRDEHVPVFLSQCECLARMTTLDLEENFFSSGAVRSLQASLPNAKIGHQRRVDVSGDQSHRAFIRRFGARSIEDIDD